MKKTLALIVAMVLALGLFAGAASAEPVPPPSAFDALKSDLVARSEKAVADLAAAAAAYQSASDTITACIGGQPETLDPQMNSASDGSNYIKHLHEGLMKHDPSGNGIVYGLADDVTISEDGLVWTFHIRDNAKWSDGQDVVADDFVYTFRRLVDPLTAAPYAGDMGKFLKNGLAIVNGEVAPEEYGVKAIDDKTLEVTLEGPCAYFLSVMAFPTFYPVRQDIVADNPGWITDAETIIGTGAYTVESYTMDSEIVLVPNENYYDANSHLAKKVVFKLIEDPNSKLAAVRNNEVLWCDDCPTEEIEATKAEGLFFLEPQLGTYYVAMNHNKAPFDNPLVRKAFVLAVDTEYLANSVGMGVYLPADNFVGPGFYEADGVTNFHDTQVVIDRSDREANIKAAQEALAEAGYPNGEGLPTIEYATNVASVHQPFAEAMAYMWKDVLGADVQVTTMDWNVFTAARRNGEHWMAREGWVADFNDPSNLLNLQASTSGNNTTFYNNPEFDKLIVASDASSDMAERMELLHQAEMLAFGQDYAAIPVCYYTTYGVANPVIKAVQTYPTGEKLFNIAYTVEG